MMLSRFIKCLAISFLLCCFSVQAEDSLRKLKVSLLLEHEAFLVWYGIEKGWDKELGLDIDLSIKNVAGIDLLNDKKVNKGAWELAGVGCVPAVIGSKGLDITYIGLGNNESTSTEIMVRPDSDILKVKGANPDYPEVYGSKETIKNKTIFIRKLTSASYILSNWLDLFGLSYTDVKVVDGKLSDFVNYMNKGNGDAMILWAPHTFEAQANGYKSAASAEQVDAMVPLFFIACSEFANKNPQTLARFLVMYDKAVKIQKEDPKSLVAAYKAFLKLYSGMDYSDEFCLYDLKSHPVYSIDEQLKLFNSERNNLSAVEKMERHLISRIEMITMQPDIEYEPEEYKHNPSDLFLKIAKRLSEEKK
ncbi:sulfonate transport system substrate-binding protein [Succinivibrio dextrinosolvens]|uniref:ABC transporter substrate-binding protein n=1 Tax=Succinivibrio dextrinosolvens TaxID=83771 RepID=UPI0008E15B0A|nr:ABC transporter substrate-binding protein [Succinivibrio dextrinosolvens]SFS71227.1 sulfonate transport system substrate-binding protein [Succinivibrio dextrinosolvens]